MKSFTDFRKASTVAEKPVYIRRKGELTYDLASDVFISRNWHQRI